MRRLFLPITVIFTGIFMIACDKSIDDYPKSNLRAISYFSFLPYTNAGHNIYMEHVGVIDEVNKLITVKLPSNVRLDSLRPNIKLSPWSIVSPENFSYVDFRPDTVELKVIAQSGKVAVYSVVKDLTYIYTKAELYAVYFPEVLDSLSNPYRGTFSTYTNNSAVTITVPENTRVDDMLVDLDLSPASHDASFEVSVDGAEALYRPFINPGRVDMTNRVSFRITPQSGTKVNYRITINVEQP